MKKIAGSVLIAVSAVFLLVGSAAGSPPKKILYVASYHTEKGEWSAGIKSGIDSVLHQRKDILFRFMNMDTRLAKSEAVKKAAALRAKALIDSWNPDVVITSDDNAARYLIMPYYKNVALPFVFCGINWDASVYGLPYDNVTGMIEVQLIPSIVDFLSPFSQGNRLGSLRGDTLSNRKEQDNFDTTLKTKMDTRYVKTLEDWKKEFIQMQDQVDILVLGSIRALDTEEASMEKIERFILANTRIPTAAYDAFMQNIVLVTLSTIPEEQGEWAAEKALEILDGKSPGDIPLVTNKKANMFLNMRLARILGIKFPMEMIEMSRLVDSEKKD